MQHDRKDETMKTIDLTDEEKHRYAGYWDIPAFTDGYDDYLSGHRQHEPNPMDGFPRGILNQAYDRGAECAMRRHRATRPPWE
jgi:hypothetical protein